MTDSVEAAGESVVDAIDAALDLLDATEDEVEVEVLVEPPEGAAPRPNAARVRVWLRDERTEEDREAERAHEQEPDLDRGPVSARADAMPIEVADEQAGAARAFLEGLLEAMDLEASVEASGGSYGAEVHVSGEDLAVLIGRHGHTLAAVQELTRAAVQRGREERATVQVDIEGYLERRIDMLERQARAAASRVRKSGKAFSFDAMPARDRKIIHDALTDYTGVRTASEGAEPHRYVVILPR